MLVALFPTVPITKVIPACLLPSAMICAGEAAGIWWKPCYENHFQNHVWIVSHQDRLDCSRVLLRIQPLILRYGSGILVRLYPMLHTQLP